MWSRMIDAIRADFVDVQDVERLTQSILRVTVAAALGGALGYERERAGKAAGLRTHMLVAIGAAVFVLAPFQSGASPADLTRVLQGVITGIGFLGAGAILKQSDAKEVRGLTTAAGIWLTAAIGAAVGLGREFTAVVCTILALVIMRLIPSGPNESA